MRRLHIRKEVFFPSFCLVLGTGIVGLINNELLISPFRGAFEWAYANLSWLFALIVAAAFVLCVLVISAIRSLSIDHAWTIAIGAGGGVLCIVVVIIGALFSETSLFWDIFGIVVSFGLAFLYEAVFFGVDYSGSERVQFEDDDYFYYVKAIPKIKPEEDERRS